MIITHQTQHYALHRVHGSLQGSNLRVAGRLVAGRPSIVVCSATSASATDSTDDTADKPKRTRRIRLFPSQSSSDSDKPPAAAAEQPADGNQRKSKAPEAPAISEEFKKAFESLGIQTLPVQQQTKRQSFADVDGRDSFSDNEQYSSSSNRNSSRSREDRNSSRSREDRNSSRSREDNDRKADRFREWGKDRQSSSSSKGSSSSFSKSSSSSKGPSWSGRGKQSSRDGPDPGSSSSRADLAKLSPEERRQQWEQEAAERDRIRAEEQRKRLIRKERSERIPTKPRPKQDKIIFQAITREWDEKTSDLERKGARAAARKIASLGLYDRNKTVRRLRQKYVQGRIDESQDPEAQKVAQRAVEQVQEAAALSIQKPKELIYQEAAGVKRSYARADALPEGERERLWDQYKAMETMIKIGRKGCSPQLVNQIQVHWRGREVVKLRVHDDKSARKMNLPRFNVLLRELEEQTGGVLIEAQGTSIWLYRGPDWKPLPVPPPYKPPEQAELFTKKHNPRGKWTDIADISCYVVSSSDTADMPSAAAADNRGVGAAASLVGAAVAGGGDVMTVLFLPDQFSMKDQPMMMQIADRIAAKGALVVMPDLLGPPAHFKHSAVNNNGQTESNTPGGNYWLINRWPVVRKRKLEHMEWFQSGGGSWLQQRPRLLQVVEEMQQQGLYDRNTPDLGAPVAAAAAAAAAEQGTSEEEPQQQQQQQQGTAAGRPLGILGFSWGSHKGLRAAGDEGFISAGLKAVAAISPMTFQKDVEIATALKVPVCLLPAKYDPMDQMMLTIDLLQRDYTPRCIFKRFGKVRPGWANWLPQWTNPRAMSQAAEQLLLAIAFLQRELLGNTAAAVLLPPPLPSAVRTAEEQEAAMKAAAAADGQGEGEQPQQEGSGDDSD